MRIRSKLFALVAGAILLMVAVISVYFISQGTLKEIESERKILLDLNGVVKDFISAINMIDSKQIDSAFSSFKEKKAAVETAFEKASKLKALPKASKELKEAVEIVQNFRQLSVEDIDRLDKAYEVLKADALEFFFMTSVTTLRDFYTNEYTRSKSDLGGVYARLEDMTTLVAGLTDTLVMTSDLIAEKNQFIDQALAAKNAANFSVFVILGLVFVGIALVIAFLITRSFSMPILGIEKTIKLISSGDLRERAATASHDELGKLGSNLNAFLASLESSIEAIKKASKENVDLKLQLGSISSEASSSSTQIEANAASIKRQIENLDGRIGGAGAALEGMTRSLVEYGERVIEQEKMIASSGDSVTAALGSVDSIGRIAMADRAAADRLVRAAEDGRIIFGETFEKLTEISENVSGIEEMAIVIQDIASRTNLLAMNASIESAHAGAYGKGFAVVADEIRNLADAASESSRSIGETIRSIVQRMELAVQVKDRATAAFETMDAQIKSVSASAKEIDALIGEIRAAIARAMDSMRSLREESAKTSEGATTIEGSAKSLGETVGEVTRVSGEVSSNIAEISLGMSDIAIAVRSVSDLAVRIGEVSERLDASINVFKTGT